MSLGAPTSSPTHCPGARPYAPGFIGNGAGQTGGTPARSRAATARGRLENSRPEAWSVTVNVSPAEPGEFTRMMGIVPPEAPAATAPGEPAKLGSSSAGVPFPSTAEPGEFTRLLKTAQPVAESIVPATAPQESGLMQVVSPPREISLSNDTDAQQKRRLSGNGTGENRKAECPGAPSGRRPDSTRSRGVHPHPSGRSATVNPAETQEMVIRLCSRLSARHLRPNRGNLPS